MSTRNGSSRNRKLNYTPISMDLSKIPLYCDRSLAECFRLFDLIHIITTDHVAVSRITKEVVEDFAAENVVYLELRTTPKESQKIGMSKRSYMEAVVDGLRAVQAVEVLFLPSRGNLEKPELLEGMNTSLRGKRKQMFVRLLLSIDRRRENTASAMETVHLALEMRHLGVVGIDLSGNPVVGDWFIFLPALHCAREHGLQVTLHCGECMSKFASRPMFGPTVSSLRDHHFDDLYQSNHPLVLCTDDAGIFSTSLSNEYYLGASTFGLSRIQMFEIARNAIKHIFADDGVKTVLNDIFDYAQPK